MTCCGLPDASSLITICPVLMAWTVGVKLTVNVHVPPGPTLLPHVLFCAKSPLGVTALIFKVTPWWLVRVAVCVGLVTPIVTFPKKRVFGLSVTGGLLVHDGNLNDAIRVFQSELPVVD